MKGQKIYCVSNIILITNLPARECANPALPSNGGYVPREDGGSTWWWSWLPVWTSWGLKTAIIRPCDENKIPVTEPAPWGCSITQKLLACLLFNQLLLLTAGSNHFVLAFLFVFFSPFIHHSSELKETVRGHTRHIKYFFCEDMLDIVLCGSGRSLSLCILGNKLCNCFFAVLKC